MSNHSLESGISVGDAIRAAAFRIDVSGRRAVAATLDSSTRSLISTQGTAMEQLSRKGPKDAVHASGAAVTETQLFA